MRRWLRSSVGDHAVDKAFGADRPVLSWRNILITQVTAAGASFTMSPDYNSDILSV